MWKVDIHKTLLCRIVKLCRIHCQSEDLFCLYDYPLPWGLLQAIQGSYLTMP